MPHTVLETMQTHLKVQCKTWFGPSALSTGKPHPQFFLATPGIANVNTGAQWASTPGSRAPKA